MPFTKKRPYINLCILFLLCTSVHAEKLTLSVAAPPFAPFAYFDATGKCIGIVEQALIKLSKASGIGFELKKFPYARIHHEMKFGVLDSVMMLKSNPLIENHSTKKPITYLGNISKIRIIIVSQTKNTVKHYSDLKQLSSIAVIRKASFNDQFDQDDSIKKVFVESYLHGLKMLKSKRVEAVIGPRIGLEHNMRKLDMDLSLLKTAFHFIDKEWGLHLATQSLNKQRREEVRQALAHLYRPNLSYLIYQQRLALQQECR